MNFDWTEDEQSLREKVRLALRDFRDPDPADLSDLRRSTLRVLGKLAESEYLSLESRNDAMALVAAQEVTARASASLFLAVEVTARLFGGFPAEFGTTKEAEDILTSVRKGEIIGAVAASESEQFGPSYSHPTEAERVGDYYRLSGLKSFVTNAPIADWIAVMGRVEGNPTIFLVRAGQPGLTLGPRLKTLGYDGLAVSTVEMRGVEVPSDLTLGPFPDGSRIAHIFVEQDRILTMASVGLMQRTVEAAKEHALAHCRDGKAIFRYQEIRFKLAEMLTLSQTAQLLAYRAAWLRKVGDSEARMVLHCAKVFSSEAAEQVASMGMQILAGQGYSRENPVGQAYRDAKFAAIAGTTSEVGRIMIAHDLLQRYRV
ncbi:MAG: acyl-CoA dehydrogenase [Thermodesulfobacteriota bacterium]